MTARDPLPPVLIGTAWGAEPDRLREALEDLASGPEPEAAANRLGQLLTAIPGLAALGLNDPAAACRLVALCASGRALPRLALVLGEEAVAPIAAEAVPAPRFDAAANDPATLRRGVAAGVLTIAGLDLTQAIGMPEVGQALSDLADAAVSAAVAMTPLPPSTRLAVIALGKWGGRELNYASDIDLTFVHDGDIAVTTAAAGRIITLLSERTTDGIAWRVDADLRPEGSAGPLTRTLDSYVAYWEQWAATWERQAMLKARFAAGDPALGAAFAQAVVAFTHPESLGAEAIREIRAMKARTESLAGDDELKRGVGGIRDVEFAVQLLQLVHGRADADLRSANTLEALIRLGDGGYVADDDATVLAAAYRWLRTVEHRIQLYDLRQTHTVPPDGDGRHRVAKSMGYRDAPGDGALQQFESDLARYRGEVRTIHERLFFRPLLEAFAAAAPADRQLTLMGFTDSTGTRAAVAELTAGLSRRSGLMKQMLPLLMEWLSQAPDPDLGLSQLRVLAGGDGGTALLVGTLRDNPVAAERLCRLLGTSRAAGRLLDRVPAVLASFGNDTALSVGDDRDTLVAAARSRSGVRVEHAERVAALHRFWGEQLLTIVAADVAGLADAVVVGHRLTAVADALVEGALVAACDEVRRHGMEPPPIAVMALGKWGGRELNYASDLDGLVVYRGSAETDTVAATRVTELVTTALSGSALGLPPPPLDLDLRPEGKKGAIARSLDSYEEYWTRWALTWEHQSLLRVRVAAGDIPLGEAFVAAAHGHAFPPHLDAGSRGAIRAMKARIEEERIPLGEDPEFHVKLGRGGLADVEWMVQLVQMEHGRDEPGLRTPSTLEALAAARHQGLLAADDAADLEAAYRFCAAVRNRLYLRAGRGRDSLPTDPIEAAVLARSLGYDINPRTALREEYRRLTRRARRVFERAFYNG
ncbi:MAG TPA: bifunctional [glutamine synthetase] adenylyltransferase/[glutamine synthetase]-adenylyl-L-tyrosine phosphorylase [Acidimicrobiia bacterium]|nr:bifunctional [glutamine synthetase] adenylyltransferase/[glutamine synthetase]-adenylyl-L-tyrosine phosphorylase [Acidimicrobiia bacterium]